MKKHFLFIAATALSISCLSQINKQVKDQIDNKDLFTLSETIKNKGLDNLSKKYAEAILSNAFGHYEESIKTIAEWKTQFGKGNDSIYSELMQVNIDNYYKSNRYDLAANTTKEILDSYGQWQSEENKKDFNNTYKIWKGLSNTPPQEILIPQKVALPFTRDLAKLINLPVNHAGGMTQGIFDTGANISVANSSTAKKMGLKIVADSVSVKAITGNEVYVEIGVADEIKIGEITIKNPYFLIFPDADLSFANGAYVINLIIGFPIIMNLGEVGFDLKNNLFLVNQEHQKNIRPNLFVDGLTPIVQLHYQKKPLLFSFDSGADRTSFYARFYDLVKDDNGLKLNAAKSTIGGAGGMKTIDVMVAPRLTLVVGKEKVKLQKSEILKENLMSKKEHLFGNLGQDVLTARNKYVFNLKEMYFELID